MPGRIVVAAPAGFAGVRDPSRPANFLRRTVWEPNGTRDALGTDQVYVDLSHSKNHHKVPNMYSAARSLAFACAALGGSAASAQHYNAGHHLQGPQHYGASFAGSYAGAHSGYSSAGYSHYPSRGYVSPSYPSYPLYGAGGYGHGYGAYSSGWGGGFSPFPLQHHQRH